MKIRCFFTNVPELPPQGEKARIRFLRRPARTRSMFLKYASFGVAGFQLDEGEIPSDIFRPAPGVFYGDHVRAIERLGRMLGFEVVHEI